MSGELKNKNVVYLLFQESLFLERSGDGLVLARMVTPVFVAFVSKACSKEG